MAEFQERAQLFQLLNNKDLEEDLHWDVYLWMIKRHWALVFHPRLDEASEAGSKPDVHHELRVDSDYLRRGDGQGCVVHIPVNQAYVVIELLVAEWPCEEFFPYLSIFPGFDESKENVANFGTAGPCKLEYITEQAMEVMRSYRMYGLVGCNCQHFAVDVLKRLPGIKDAPSPDDQRLAEVIEKSAQAISITNGVLKGLFCAKTASTLGSSLATGGVAGGAAGTMALGVGVAVLTGHILCGCAVGAAASTGHEKRPAHRVAPEGQKRLPHVASAEEARRGTANGGPRLADKPPNHYVACASSKGGTGRAELETPPQTATATSQVIRPCIWRGRPDQPSKFHKGTGKGRGRGPPPKPKSKQGRDPDEERLTVQDMEMPVQRILRTLAKAVKDLDFAVNAASDELANLVVCDGPARCASYDSGQPSPPILFALRLVGRRSVAGDGRTRRDALPTIQKKGVRRGYEWVSNRHRRAEQAADGAEPKGHVEECSECKECLPSPGDVVGPLQPDKSSKASSNDVAESIRVEGPLGMI
ncbi:unnamed protein product [Symbiodinium sp. KB8]|nr:unnamed protein product [Symbiodinium sp. KB8]